MIHAVTAEDVGSAVRQALAEKRPLEILGHGSKRAIGRPMPGARALDLSGLAGVTLYEPEELVLSAKAGTPLAEIAALLAAKNQQMAFEPMDFAALLGVEPGVGTIGGMIAANLSGPRRVKAGAARDHFLGFSAVSGRGETFKSGGRVVKNVTGYDLSKLMAGSWGTLAVMTDVTIKVLPAPETEETLLVVGTDAEIGGEAMRAAMAAPADVSGAAHVPASLSGAVAGLDGTESVTALRLEGVAPSIAHRRVLLEGLLKGFGALASLDAARSRALWVSIRDVAPFAAAGPRGGAPVWRVSTAPSAGPALAGRLARECGAEVLYDWAGGLLWVAVPPSADAGAAALRAAVAAAGGHATLIRAEASVRAAVAVFEPVNGTLAELTKRVRESFDPMGVLNPGRMHAGV